MKNAKNIITVIIVILALIVILQNAQQARVDFLFFEVNMPLFILLLVTLGLGVLVGLLMKKKLR